MPAVKHTLGPWLSQGICYEGEERGACFVVADNAGGLVGAALPWPTEMDEGDFPRVEANARLMAAAPSMLEALKSAAGLANYIQKYTTDAAAKKAATDVQARCEAAIAKAEGSL